MYRVAGEWDAADPANKRRAIKSVAAALTALTSHIIDEPAPLMRAVARKLHKVYCDDSWLSPARQVLCRRVPARALASPPSKLTVNPIAQQMLVDLLNGSHYVPARHRRYHRHIVLVALMSGDRPPTRAELRDAGVTIAGKVFKRVRAVMRNPGDATSCLVPAAVERNLPPTRVHKAVAFLLSPVCVRPLAYGSKTVRNTRGEEVSQAFVLPVVMTLAKVQLAVLTRTATIEELYRMYLEHSNTEQDVPDRVGMAAPEPRGVTVPCRVRTRDVHSAGEACD